MDSTNYIINARSNKKDLFDATGNMRSKINDQLLKIKPADLLNLVVHLADYEFLVREDEFWTQRLVDIPNDITVSGEISYLKYIDGMTKGGLIKSFTYYSKGIKTHIWVQWDWTINDIIRVINSIEKSSKYKTKEDISNYDKDGKKLLIFASPFVKDPSSPIEYFYHKLPLNPIFEGLKIYEPVENINESIWIVADRMVLVAGEEINSLVSKLENENMNTTDLLEIGYSVDSYLKS